MRPDWERLAAAGAVLATLGGFLLWSNKYIALPLWRFLVRSGLRLELAQLERHEKQLKEHTDMLGAAVYSIGQLTSLASRQAETLAPLAALPGAIGDLSANVAAQSEILGKLREDVSFLKGARDEAKRQDD